MNLKNKILSAAASILGSALMLTGCIAEDLDMRDRQEMPEGTNLVFDIAVPTYDGDYEGSYIKEGLHGEAKEAYIDQSKFKVLFFDKLGNFLFEVDPQFITLYDRGLMADGVTPFSSYRVNLPHKYLFSDDLEGTPLGDAIEKAVLKDGFKVAVLANWPKSVEGHRESDFTGDEFVSSQVPAEFLDFEFDPDHIKPNSKIEHLHHCIYDNVYGERSNAEAFGHLTSVENGAETGENGVYSVWVSNLFKTHRDAESFIRAGKDEYQTREFMGDIHFDFNDNTGEVRKAMNSKWTGDPSTYDYTTYSYTRTIDNNNKYHLDNLWRVWNFSAGDVVDFFPPLEGRNMDPTVKKYWHNRNQYVLIEGLKKAGIDGNPNSFTIVHKGDTVINTGNSKAQYHPVNGTEGGYLSLPNEISSTQYESLNKSANSWNTEEQKNGTSFKNSALHFKVYGEGYLKITAKVPEGSNGKIGVMISNAVKGQEQLINLFDRANNIAETGVLVYDPANAADVNPANSGYTFGEFMINPNSFPFKEVYVGALDGEVEIYEVDYVRSRHIYDSARNAIMPSEEFPIPMYGIQTFEGIEDYIVADHTFNMSVKDENMHLPSDKREKYNFHFIYLLRSVAKVEIRFKESVFRNNLPEHVFMRVMNRSAYCCPMDVINPTEWIWFGHEALSNPFLGNRTETIPDEARPETFVGAEQEFKNLIAFGPLHKDRTLDSKGYRDMTTWFYGNWTEEAEDESLQQYFPMKAWTFTEGFSGYNATMTHREGTLPFPRIFNTRIDRSDYCRFHNVGRVRDKDTGEWYISYVMYCPEKNIDDADTKGQLSVRPKIQHVEMKFKGMNEAANFDDNDCYRIYFTDYVNNGSTMKEYNRDGSITRVVDGKTVYDTYDFTDAEQYSDEFLKLLQPVMRNCHYIFTVNSINDAKADVRMTVCGAATRNPNFVIK